MDTGAGDTGAGGASDVAEDERVVLNKIIIISYRKQYLMLIAVRIMKLVGRGLGLSDYGISSVLEFQIRVKVSSFHAPSRLSDR